LQGVAELPGSGDGRTAPLSFWQDSELDALGFLGSGDGGAAALHSLQGVAELSGSDGRTAPLYLWKDSELDALGFLGSGDGGAAALHSLHGVDISGSGDAVAPLSDIFAV
ncbi:hypothetical protein V493_00066, partial [Pseudogymnoascus sp. VKM F-4281 (FW-2241)]